MENKLHTTFSLEGYVVWLTGKREKRVGRMKIMDEKKK